MQLNGCFPKSLIDGIGVDLVRHPWPIVSNSCYETLVVDYFYEVRMFAETPTARPGARLSAQLFITQYTDVVWQPPPLPQPVQALRVNEQLAALRLLFDQVHGEVLQVHLLDRCAVASYQPHKLTRLAQGLTGVTSSAH